MSKLTHYDRMTKTQRAKLRKLCLKVSCPYCRSGPGESCRGVAGKPSKPHWDRRRKFSSQFMNGPDFAIHTSNVSSNIPEGYSFAPIVDIQPQEDTIRNGEQSALNRMFPCSTKVYTPEQVTGRLDSIETILRVILDRLSEVDGRRLVDVLAPFGYNVSVTPKQD